MVQSALIGRWLEELCQKAVGEGTYGEQEAAVLLQGTDEAQEGDAGDDDAGDQQQVGRGHKLHGVEQRVRLVADHVHPEAQHRGSRDLWTARQNALAFIKRLPTKTVPTETSQVRWLWCPSLTTPSVICCESPRTSDITSGRVNLDA